MIKVGQAKKTFASLFCGIGGMDSGFEAAGFEEILALDYDPVVCKNHGIVCHREGTQADLAVLNPEELRAMCPRRPDVLVSSPPCVAFSGCLPLKMAKTQKYLDISSLVERSLWVALEAWADDPPLLIVIENVPEIQKSRGRKWLDALAKTFQAYGYVWRETKHDCGELGHLAQHRHRFLGVARRTEEFLYEPPKHRVRGVGEIIGELPVPLPGVEQPWKMHQLGRLSLLNWTRLALIGKGKDWRALPEQIAFACTPRQGVYGVRPWDQPSGTIVGAARWDNGTYSVADPRVIAERRYGLGVTPWDGPTHAIIGEASVQNTGLQVADPRLHYQKRNGAMRVCGWEAPTGCIIGEARSYQGQNVADPRLRNVELVVEGPDAMDLDDERPVHAVILSEDGTWCRPMTDGELYLLQGFPGKRVDGTWYELVAPSKKVIRKMIGNAVPPPVGRAIAESCMKTLIAHDNGGFDAGPTTPIWVINRRQEIDAAF